MKKILFLLILSYSCVKAAAFFQYEEEKVVKIVDFPDNEYYQTKDGEYIDIGLRYKQLSIFFIPVWNYNETWCGYIGNNKNYLNISKNALFNVAKDINIEIPQYPKKPFWDAVGGKLLLLSIILSALFYKINIFQRQENEVINKRLYLAMILLGYFVGLPMLVIARIVGYDELILLGFLIFILAPLLQMRIIYKAWSSIQDEYSSTTPWKATFFLLVPIFNMYWIFKSSVGFANDYNEYIKRYKLRAEPVSTTLFQALSWTFVLSIILNKIAVFSIINFIISIITSIKTIDIANTLNNYGSKETDANKIKNSEYALIVALLAKVAKADGKIDELEAKIVKSIISEISKEYKKPQEAREIFKKIFNDEKNNAYNLSIKAAKYFELTKKDYNKRVKSIEILLSIAFADKSFTKQEHDIINSISEILQIDQNDLNVLISEFKSIYSKNKIPKNSSLENACKILEVSIDDTMSEIKKRYKELVRKYHPDIISAQGVDEDFIKLATEKLQDINNAYETIKNYK